VYNYTEDDQFATRYLYCTNTVQQFFVEFHIDTKAPFGIGDRKDVDFSVDTN